MMKNVDFPISNPVIAPSCRRVPVMHGGKFVNDFGPHGSLDEPTIEQEFKALVIRNAAALRWFEINNSLLKALAFIRRLLTRNIATSFQNRFCHAPQSSFIPL